MTRSLYLFDSQYEPPVAGVDEAGRGCLAGPVFAACVVLQEYIEGINDSKQLRPEHRAALDIAIRERALFVGVGIASVEEIERFNILNASLLAMRRASDGVPSGVILVDGNKPFCDSPRVVCVPHGDASSYAIAAASIVAKTARDRHMEALHIQYPLYGFAKHKGYGTLEHREAILRYGPCAEHRTLFLRKLSKLA